MKIEKDFESSNPSYLSLHEIINHTDKSDEHVWYDLVPDFQRDYVWNEKKAQEFISTILRKEPFPEIEFTNYLEEPNKFECFNGSQRLRTCKAFKTGEWITNESGVKFKVTDTNNRSWDSLTKEERMVFSNCKVSNVVHTRKTKELCQDLKRRFKNLNTCVKIMSAQALFNTEHSDNELFKYLRKIAQSDEWGQYNFLKTRRGRSNRYLALYGIFALSECDLYRSRIQSTADLFFKERENKFNQPAIDQKYKNLKKIISAIELEKIVDEAWLKQTGGRASYVHIVFVLSFLLRQNWTQIDKQRSKIKDTLAEIFKMGQLEILNKVNKGSVDKSHKALYDMFQKELGSLFTEIDDSRPTEEIKKKLYHQQSGICKQCDLPLSSNINESHADHIYPRSLGGKNEESNLQLLHASCNLEKSNQVIEDVSAEITV